MPAIRCSIPTLISDCTGGHTAFTLEADRLDQALQTLSEAYPLLRIHLFTESGDVREHVLLFLNDDNLAWLDDWQIPLKEGDRLTVLQAVSGG